MKTKFIINGEIQLVIIPENDRERELLAACKNHSVTHLDTTSQILGEVVTGGLVLTEKTDK